MRITWQGLACFRIEGGGLSIITDPYTPGRAGHGPIDKPADLVVRSSKDDTGHCREDMVPGTHEVVEAIDIARKGPERVAGIEFEAFEASERMTEGRDAIKANAMYRFELDGLSILHTGDIGIPFPEEHLQHLKGRVDVMLAVTGDRLTIALPDLFAAIEAIRPRVVIPCHYQVRQLKLRRYWLYPVQAFLSLYPEESHVWVDGPSTELTSETLPAEFKILVLDAER